MRLAVALTLLLAGCSEAPFPLIVTFPETGGLKPGDNVVLRGLGVGQVKDIDIEGAGVAVRIEVQPRYQEHLREGLSFSVAQEKMVTGKQRLVAEPAASPGAPLKPGARIQGAAIAPDAVDRLKGALTDSVDHAREQATGLGRAMLAPDDQPPRATGGTVDLDRPGSFVLRLLSVRVEETSADGSDWDGVGAGHPDLLAQVWVAERQVLLTGVAEDVLEVSWDAVSQPFDLPPATLVRVKVLDRDTSFNDEIGVLELTPAAADADSGRVFRLAGGRIAEAKLRLERAPAGP